MSRRSDFYKGRRKKRNYAIIPGVILLLVFSVGIVLFYSTQKYAVISDDGVTVELPLLSSGAKSYDESGQEVREFERVNVTVQFEEADYSTVKQTVSGRVPPLRAIFIPYDDIDPETVTGYANRLSSGNALLLEVKKEDGYLKWYSDTPTAKRWGLNMGLPDSKEMLTSVVSQLKSDGIYVIAQISCLQDFLLGGWFRNEITVTLKDAYGKDYYNEEGYWLDPYSTLVRDYVVELVQELWDMGFDEVVLDNVRHPVVEDIENADGTVTSGVQYSRDMSTTPSPLSAVSGFAVNVGERLADREEGKYLSIYVHSTAALAKGDTSNGQDSGLFLKLYDRVYYDTDKYAYTFNVQDITPLCKAGDVKNRFVPVVINYLPDNTSWVLVDSE